MSTPALVAVYVVVGLFAGVFVNMVIERAPVRDRAARVPLLRPPNCPSCGYDRRVVHWLPIVSWARPACSQCDTRPSRRETVVQLVTAALFGVVAVRFHDGAVLAPYLLFTAVLVAVSVIDLKYYRIPDRVVFPALALSVPAVIVVSLTKSLPEAIPRALLGAAVYFGILFLFHMISPRGMGFGDVKLALVLGLYVGWLGGTLFEAAYLVVIAMFFGGLLGSAVGVAVAFSRGRKAHFPFGPALCAGALMAVLLSNHLVA